MITKVSEYLFGPEYAEVLSQENQISMTKTDNNKKLD